MNAGTRKPRRSPPTPPDRLCARPRPLGADHPALAPGLHVVLPHGRRPALLQLPLVAADGRAVPLVVMLHGSGGEPQHGLAHLQPHVDAAGIAVLAPASHDYTWDALLGGFGPDVQAIDEALGWVFERAPVDPARLAIGGFSDGASYGLSLALANGDLFGCAIALSPGFIAPTRQSGSPRIFISHGASDEVLPIDPCSRRIVAQLQQAGYEVDYLEFAGGHDIPGDVARRAVAFLLG